MTQEGKSRICSLLNLERKNLKRISFVKKASAGNATQVIGWFCSKSGQREALYSWENLHSKRWMDLIKMWQGSCVEFYYNVQLVIVVHSPRDWQRHLGVVAYDLFIFNNNIQTTVLFFVYFFPGWQLLCGNCETIQKHVLQFLIYINIMAFSLIILSVNPLGMQFQLIWSIRITSRFFFMLYWISSSPFLSRLEHFVFTP